jgi:Fe-S cluster biogenesis protein NfuA/nitrite reductase/ring-hydroxylating ferredoxin subunit
MAPDIREVGSRIESLLADLRSGADDEVAERAEELVRLLMELYGSGLERIVELVADGGGGIPPGQGGHFRGPVAERLLGDPFVASLLVLHGLHPVPVEDRIHAALEEVRPYLGSHAGGVEFLGVDDQGVAQVKLQGSCEGCASSTITVKYAIENAILKACPEVTGVFAEGVDDEPKGPALHQIGSRPQQDRWAHIDGLRLLPGQVTTVEVEGTSLLVCSVTGSLYAYRDACPACASGLAGGVLEGQVFRCPQCGTPYDVVLAGRGPEEESLHLDPVPLLPDEGGVKVALPQSVLS